MSRLHTDNLLVTSVAGPQGGWGVKTGSMERVIAPILWC